VAGLTRKEVEETVADYLAMLEADAASSLTRPEHNRTLREALVAAQRCGRVETREHQRRHDRAGLPYVEGYNALAITNAFCTRSWRGRLRGMPHFSSCSAGDARLDAPIPRG